MARLPVLGCLLGACLLAGLLMGPAAASTVRDVTLLPHDNGVRVVIDLGSKVPFQHRTFDDPPRLVIELPDVSWQIPERRGQRSYRMIRGFQFGRLGSGVPSLIVDVDRPFEIETVFELPPSDSSGYRIVTDLAPLPANAPMRRQRVRSKTFDAETAAATPDVPPLHRPTRRPAAEQPTEPAGRAANAETRRARERFAAGAVPIPAPRPTIAQPKRIIVIDPGHGGIDPGASGRGGTYEKNVVLAMALELRRQLVDSGRYDVILTRDDDSFVRLRDRLQIARASAGHLFLSLHADSLAKHTDVHGAAVYTLSDQASDEEAERLASVENRADILGGIDLSHQEPLVTQILIDLAQRDANSKSLKIADLLVAEIGDVTKLLRRKRQQAGFVVLKSPDMPSALVELGYLSNEKDERRLTDRDHLSDLADAMVKAIDRYFGAPQS
ncbi:MAG: N-acetylmuramoyl-L-alanine amidase [Geminicoccaceae bacterium]